jgi:hypothetical protein
MMSDMIQTTSAVPTGRGISEAMIGLTGCSRSRRIIVAGARGRELMLELHRRGYTRVETTGTCGLPRGQCQAALLDGQLQSVKAIETTLCWLVHFLASGSVLVIGVGSGESASGRKLRSMLEGLAFQIEVETRCEDGAAFMARRRDAVEINVAA